MNECNKPSVKTTALYICEDCVEEKNKQLAINNLVDKNASCHWCGEQNNIMFSMMYKYDKSIDGVLV